MSVDLEAGGALVTAGLAANEMDALNKEGAPKHPDQTTCANCNAKLDGAYCQRCGQSSHVHRSLWHMFEESLHGIFHFDTKSWRTLPLLVARPGLLTKRYIDGQRVRYVSPLALFLFSVFLMFFAFSFVSNPTKDAADDPAQRAAVRAELAADLAKAQKASDVPADEAASPSDAKVDQQTAEAALAAFDKAMQLADAAKSNVPDTSSAENLSPSTHVATTKIETGNAKLDEFLHHGLRDSEFFTYRLKNTAYKYSFMLIPISLPFLWLMFFWRKDVRLYDHAVFSLYSLSFMSLFFVVVALIGLIPGAVMFTGLAFLLPPVHMFLQLRETYGLGVFSALWRTVALLGVAGTVFMLFMVMIAVISMT